MADELVSGVGGAGLFSDGKFSFYPSATRLWDLTPQAILAAAYGWYSGVLADLPWAQAIPTLPEPGSIPENNEYPSGVFDKSYPSYYTSLAQRTQLVQQLVEALGASLVTNVDIDEIRSDGPDRMVVATRDRRSGYTDEVACRALVVGTGRLGPLELVRQVPEGRWQSGRLEIGVRLEQPTEEFILAAHESVDPKLITRDADGTTARTFCCCRDGEVVVTDSRGIVTVSGRSDIAPTGKSNVGLVVRPNDRMLNRDPSLLDRVTDAGRHLTCDVAAFFDSPETEDLAAILGMPVTASIQKALRAVCDAVGRDVPSVGTIHGVAVEGVGRYPLLSSDLRWGPGPTWIAGDATGLFRGITAAFVSGYFVGECARLHLTSDRHA